MNATSVTSYATNSWIPYIIPSYTDILSYYNKNININKNSVYPIQSDDIDNMYEDDQLLNDNGLDISDIIISSITPTENIQIYDPNVDYDTDIENDSQMFEDEDTVIDTVVSDYSDDDFIDADDEEETYIYSKMHIIHQQISLNSLTKHLANLE
jgi:hypothetical protein